MNEIIFVWFSVNNMVKYAFEFNINIYASYFLYLPVLASLYGSLRDNLRSAG